MHLSLNDALKYATKVQAPVEAYHKAFDRIAADPKAEEAFKEGSLTPLSLFAGKEPTEETPNPEAGLLEKMGLHPHADFIRQAMKNAQRNNEPVVYSEQIDRFPPHHREILEGLGQGDFHLVLGKPNSDYTTAALYQRSHTDPSKVFGWTDTIEGNPDEVKEEVERFHRAGVPVELAMGPQHPQYDKWAKHFGLSGHSEEEPEQYAKKKGRSLVEVYADFIADTDTEGWTEQEKAGLSQLNKAEKSAIERGSAGGFLKGSHLNALVAAYKYHALRGNSKVVREVVDRLDFLRVPKLPHAEGQVLPFDDLSMVTDTGVSAGQPVKVLLTGYHNPEQVGEPLFRTVVTPETKSLSQMDLKGSRYGSLERALKYVQETHADFHNRILEDIAATTPPLVYADWLQEEQNKPALAEVIRKHIGEQSAGPEHLTKGRLHFWPPGRMETLTDEDPNATTFHYSPEDGLTLQQHSAEKPDDTLVWRVGASPETEELAKRLHKEGSIPVGMPAGWEAHKDPVLKSVNPTYGEIADPVSEHFSATDKPLRYSAVPEHEIHEDYAPNGIAPRIGHTLKQLALEDSTTGALAEGILRTGDHSILPILADRLEETDHPMASAFDWRHAPRAIRIDRALHRQISQRQVRHPDGHRVPLTAGWVIADMQDGVQRPAFSRRKALLAARLAVPDATTEDLLHSLFRLMDHREVADTAPELVEPVAAHTKALTAARLQQLRQRQGDPYHYEDTRQQNKRLYGSWRAPAGGMVVQQSPLAVSGQWAEGGEFVNDLSKLPSQSVEYKKRPKKRLTVEYIRQHFRKAKRKNSGVTVVTGGSDSEGGDSGEGE